MAKKVVKMKSISTNVRYIKTVQRGIHVLLTALWHVWPNATKNIVSTGFLNQHPMPSYLWKDNFLKMPRRFIFMFMTKEFDAGNGDKDPVFSLFMGGTVAA